MYACTRTSDASSAAFSLQTEDHGIDAEMTEDMRSYEDIIDEAVHAARSHLRLSRQLAQRYVENRLYGDALEVAEAGLQRGAEDSELFYIAGISSGYLAKASFETELREMFFDKAEFYYAQALLHDPQHQQALYAAAVLYLFERVELDKASEFLYRLEALRSNDVNLRFLFARMHILSGDVEQAIQSYEWIVQRSKASSEQRTRAEENLRSLKEGFRAGS